MIIDVHHHLEKSPGYADKLAATCRRLGIGKVCLFGAGKHSTWYDVADNDAVLQAMHQHPDLILGFACVDLGDDHPGIVDEFARRGFKGLKFINPAHDYDDRSFYPVYARAEAYQLPVLFHLGIVSRHAKDHVYDVDNDRHRPIFLDTIARAFPNLQIIGAHFGNPWYEEAAMAARWNTNLYFDLTGSTLKCKSARFLGDLLWWTPTTRYSDPLKRHAWEKIVFGSDVSCDEIEDVMKDYKRVMGELQVPAEVQAKVMGQTMARLLGLTRDADANH